MLKDGRQFPRPANMPKSALQNVSFEGPAPFTYTGSPSSPNESYLISSMGTMRLGPTQPTRQPASQIRRNQPLQTLDGDKETQVVFQTATQSQIQRREPARPPAITERGISIGDNVITSRLFPEYRVQKKSFFQKGRVFQVLWSEPAGGASVVSRWQPGIILNHFGERVFSKARRFVVIREADNYCNALPISTYGGQGLAKRGVTKADHCIIFTSAVAPVPRPNERPSRVEDGMRPVPIRVDPDSPAEVLDPMSRLNLAAVTIIHHNLRAKSSGKVNMSSLRELMMQFENVWGNFPIPAPSKFSHQEEKVSAVGDEDKDEEGDEEEDDEEDEDGEDGDEDEDDEDEDEEDHENENENRHKPKEGMEKQQEGGSNDRGKDQGKESTETKAKKEVQKNEQGIFGWLGRESGL